MNEESTYINCGEIKFRGGSIRFYQGDIFKMCYKND